jgi:hypothetical protein
MLDENVRDQFDTVPKLARLLAADKSFVCEIGLDEYERNEIIQRLQLVIGFVLSMHNAAKSIFRSGKDQTLDDKFIELIYSRIRLMPELVESTSQLREHAERCYYMHRMREESGKKWEDMALHEQFFEICVCVFLEEMKLDRPDLHILLPEFERISSRSILACTFKGVFSYITWELDDKPDSPTRAEGDDADRLDEVEAVSQGETLKHPFFQDWVEAVQSYYRKTLEDEELGKIRQVSCSLYPEPILARRWDGWQLGIPRPNDLIGEEAFNFYNEEATVFLRHFFNRVENDKLYCEWSDVIDRFGEETVANRMPGETGVHHSLERVYWTFNIKFNNWIRQNKEEYDCSLVCQLDEIIARADSVLREAFFPTPGPVEIGHRRRKEYQIKLLRDVAPNIEKQLIEDIWD